MMEGTPGHALWPALDVLAEDETVLKRRFSAFIQGSSDLPQRLRARGFDTVLIGGTVTFVVWWAVGAGVQAGAAALSNRRQ